MKAPIGTYLISHLESVATTRSTAVVVRLRAHMGSMYDRTEVSSFAPKYVQLSY